MRRVKPARTKVSPFFSFLLLMMRSSSRKACAKLTRVDVDGLPAGRRVDADDRVDGLDGLSANGVPGRPRAVGLRDCTVHRVQALEVFLEVGAE